MNTFDLSVPSHLLAALLPDLILMGGAMLLLLYAVWRRESPAHQRQVGLLSIVLAVITLVVVVWTMYQRGTAAPGAHRRRQLPLDG